VEERRRALLQLLASVVRMVRQDGIDPCHLDAVPLARRRGFPLDLLHQRGDAVLPLRGKGPGKRASLLEEKALQ
jgi:hypothetical protein